MADLREGWSALLAASQLRDFRALLDGAFDGDFSDDDSVHALGGTHVWVDGPDGAVSHGALVERTLVCFGRSSALVTSRRLRRRTAYRRRGLRVRRS